MDIIKLWWGVYNNTLRTYMYMVMYMSTYFSISITYHEVLANCPSKILVYCSILNFMMDGLGE